MTLDRNEIKQLISKHLSVDFPELKPEIEPRFKNKVEIKEKEVKVHSPVVQAEIPKVGNFIEN
jgi:hypothetical protein